MPDKAWKALERQVGKDHDGQRRPVMGHEKGATDVDCPKFAIQVKLRDIVLPQYITEPLDALKASPTSDGKTPFALLKSKHKPLKKALVCMYYEDWLDYKQGREACEHRCSSSSSA